jgi:uncharacterized protein YegL
VKPQTKKKAQIAIAIAILLFAGVISYFSVSESKGSKYDVYLVLDVSGSMGDPSGTGIQLKIDALKDAALNFVQAAQVGSNPNIRVGLISFSDVVSVNSGLTSDRNLLYSGINSLSPNGMTAVGDAIQQAVVRLEQERNPDASCFIVLMTDGQSNSDTVATPLTAAGQASQNNIVVDAVAFGADANVTACQEISAKGNGQFFYAATSDQLVSSFAGIAASFVSPVLHYGSRILMLIAIPLILFLPEIEKGTHTIVRSFSTTVLKRPAPVGGVRCPRCEHLNRAESKFCGACNAPLAPAGVKCQKCGHVSRTGAKFCGNCRSRLESGEK